MIYIGLVHDKFCLVLFERLKPMCGGHSQNADPDSAITSSWTPYFENTQTLGLHPTHRAQAGCFLFELIAPDFVKYCLLVSPCVLCWITYVRKARPQGFTLHSKFSVVGLAYIVLNLVEFGNRFYQGLIQNSRSYSYPS
jgi:hypothetical protein